MDKLDQQLQYSIHGEFDLGWKLVQELEKERPYCNRCAFNRGWYVLAQGKLREGMELIARGRFENVFGSPPLRTYKPIFNIRDLNHKLEDKFVLLNLEGGFGDEIIGFRFVNEISRLGGKAIVAAHPKLMSLFSSQKNVSGLVSFEAARAVYHDFWIPSMSAELCFDNTFETLPNKPYIEAKTEFVEKFKKIIKKDTFNIGIRWIGLPDFEHEQFRRFPDHLLFDIVNNYKNNKNIKFYSLQKDLADKNNLPKHIIDLDSCLETWDDTSGAIANLDLVISSCTSVPHLSGAMGIPTWVIVPILPYYIWAYRLKEDPISRGEYTSYYRNHRLFRQEKFGQWREPFEKIKIGLNNLLKEKNLIS